MLAIYKKEMRSYFINAVGYVYVGVFLALAALLCCYTTLQSNSYSTSSYFQYIIFAMIILIPLLTMRMFAEERKMRTEQMLLTSPVTIFGMVMGKFCAALTLFVGSLVLSCINFIPLYATAASEIAAKKAEGDWLKGDHIGPNTAQIWGSLIGVALIGAAFIAIGLFVSSLTENQLSAAVITIGVLLTMIVINILSQAGSDEDGTRLITSYAVRYVLDWFSVLSRFSNFGYGILDWSALIYYVSLTFIFLYLTVRVYERRRWA